MKHIYCQPEAELLNVPQEDILTASPAVDLKDPFKVDISWDL